MLGKASEVASAAEQSALAMRDAAETSAGLIRAIEDARREVETAAGIATRAGEEAAGAMEASRALSSHVEAIESILGLIRDIAGQTNLLASTPPRGRRARRCRPSFAVVAQEVKTLASQTARATEHHRQDHAIQQATDTRSTPTARSSRPSRRFSFPRPDSRAMEVQAQTVTMITPPLRR